MTLKPILQLGNPILRQKSLAVSDPSTPEIAALIQDLKGSGVRINILSPGAVDTPSLRRALGKATGPEGVDRIVQSMAQRSPLGRIGEAEEVAEVILFLASDRSSYITGQTLQVDGGATLPQAGTDAALAKLLDRLQ